MWILVMVIYATHPVLDQSNKYETWQACDAARAKVETLAIRAICIKAQ